MLKAKVRALVVVYLLGYSELRLPWSSIDASHLGDPPKEVVRKIESDPPVRKSHAKRTWAPAVARRSPRRPRGDLFFGVERRESDKRERTARRAANFEERFNFQIEGRSERYLSFVNGRRASTAAPGA